MSLKGGVQQNDMDGCAEGNEMFNRNIGSKFTFYFIPPSVVKTMRQARHEQYVEDCGLSDFVSTVAWDTVKFPHSDLIDFISNFDGKQTSVQGQKIELNMELIRKTFQLEGGNDAVGEKTVHYDPKSFKGRKTQNGFLLSSCVVQTVKERLEFQRGALHIQGNRSEIAISHIKQVEEPLSGRNWGDYFGRRFFKLLGQTQLQLNGGKSFICNLGTQIQVILGSHLFPSPPLHFPMEKGKHGIVDLSDTSVQKEKRFADAAQLPTQPANFLFCDKCKEHIQPLLHQMDQDKQIWTKEQTRLEALVEDLHNQVNRLKQVSSQSDQAVDGMDTNSKKRMSSLDTEPIEPTNETFEFLLAEYENGNIDRDFEVTTMQNVGESARKHLRQCTLQELTAFQTMKEDGDNKISTPSLSTSKPDIILKFGKKPVEDSLHLHDLVTMPKKSKGKGTMQEERTERRKGKKWSAYEVQTLEEEVQRFGKGHWKAILHKNKDVFAGRTEVDLKDKWRNVEKMEKAKRMT